MGAAPPAHVNAPTQAWGLVLGEAVLPGSLGPPWGFKVDVPHYSSENGREFGQTDPTDRQKARDSGRHETRKADRQADRRTDRQTSSSRLHEQKKDRHIDRWTDSQR